MASQILAAAVGLVALAERSPVRLSLSHFEFFQTAVISNRMGGIGQLQHSVVGTSWIRVLELRERQPERLLGRKTMDVEILEEALDVASKNRTFSCHHGTSRFGLHRQ
jgi:hypothetical protein